jgi:hypothetical protein
MSSRRCAPYRRAQRRPGRGHRVSPEPPSGGDGGATSLVRACGLGPRAGTTGNGQRQRLWHRDDNHLPVASERRAGSPARRAGVTNPRSRRTTPTGPTEPRCFLGSAQPTRTCPGRGRRHGDGNGSGNRHRADDAASPAAPPGTTGDVRSSERLTPAGRPLVDGRPTPIGPGRRSDPSKRRRGRSLFFAVRPSKALERPRAGTGSFASQRRLQHCSALEGAGAPSGRDREPSLPTTPPATETDLATTSALEGAGVPCCRSALEGAGAPCCRSALEGAGAPSGRDREASLATIAGGARLGGIRIRLGRVPTSRRAPPRWARSGGGAGFSLGG